MLGISGLRVSEQFVKMVQYRLCALVEMLKRRDGAIQRKFIRRTALGSCASATRSSQWAWTIIFLSDANSPPVLVEPMVAS